MRLLEIRIVRLILTSVSVVARAVVVSVGVIRLEFALGGLRGFPYTSLMLHVVERNQRQD